MHWIAPSEKDTDNAAHVSSLSASQGERVGVKCRSFMPLMGNAGRNGGVGKCEAPSASVEDYLNNSTTATL